MLHYKLERIFEEAQDHFTARFNFEDNNAYVTFAAEYAAGLDVIDSLVNEEGEFTSPEALLIVKRSLTNYRDNLGVEGFPLKRRQLALLLDEIKAVEEASAQEDETEARLEHRILLSS